MEGYTVQIFTSWVKYSVLCLVAQSCPTVCDPMDWSPPGSSVHGDSPGKNTGVGCHVLLQGTFPTQGWNRVSFTTGRFFTVWAPGKPPLQVDDAQLWAPPSPLASFWVQVSGWEGCHSEENAGGWRGAEGGQPGDVCEFSGCAIHWQRDSGQIPQPLWALGVLTSKNEVRSAPLSLDKDYMR